MMLPGSSHILSTCPESPLLLEKAVGSRLFPVKSLEFSSCVLWNAGS